MLLICFPEDFEKGAIKTIMPREFSPLKLGQNPYGRTISNFLHPARTIFFVAYLALG